MKKVWGKKQEVHSKSGLNSGLAGGAFQHFSCMLKTVILGMTMLSIFIVEAGAAPAQSPATSTGNDAKYEQMLRRMEILEERLRVSESRREALTEEVQRLKADLEAVKSGKQGLQDTKTTASGTELHSEKAPLLAKEPPSAKLAAEPSSFSRMTAGWDKGFYIRSSDGDFELRPVGILNLDFRGHEDERQINTDETLASTFDIRRLRLGFEGFIFKNIGYTLEVNIDENETELIYAYLNFGEVPWASLRAGQFKEPFSYEVLYSEKFLDFVERSNIATAVAPAEDIGIMVHNFGKPYAGMFEYGLGMFNSEGIHLNNKENRDMEAAGRMAILPFANGHDWLKKIKIAANATYSGKQQRDFGFRPRTSEGFEFFPRLPVKGERLRWGVDAQWYYGPFSLKTQYIRAEEERSNGLPKLITDGWHLDATWLVTGEEKKLAMESGWELAARYEEIRVDAQIAFAVPGFLDKTGSPVIVTDNMVRTFTLGLNRYVNYNVKFQINYQHSWLDHAFLTPTSRTGSGVLEPGDDQVDKVLARVQLFF